MRLKTNCCHVCSEAYCFVAVLLSQENFDSITIELDGEDMGKIASLNRNIRLNDPLVYWGVDVWGYGQLPAATGARTTK